MKNNLFTIVLIFVIWILVILGCSQSNVNLENKLAEQNTKITATPKAEPSILNSELKVTKQEYGDSWAFTVDEGVLSCKGKNGLGEVVFTSNGKTYAVNGTAKSTKKYLPIEEIWADDPKISRANKDIGLFIEKGLKLCQ